MGVGNECAWAVEGLTASYSQVRIRTPHGEEGEIAWSLIGRHNAENALSAVSAAAHAGRGGQGNEVLGDEVRAGRRRGRGAGSGRRDSSLGHQRGGVRAGHGVPVPHGVPVVCEERLDGVIDGARGRVPGRDGATHGAVPPPPARRAVPPHDSLASFGRPCVFLGTRA